MQEFAHQSLCGVDTLRSNPYTLVAPLLHAHSDSIEGADLHNVLRQLFKILSTCESSRVIITKGRDTY